MKEISLKNLKEYLKQRSKEDLINEISGLFTRFEYVKDYYQAKLSQNDAQVLQKYKDIIEEALFPTRGFGKARLSVARKAISDYQKMSPSSKDLADIIVLPCKNFFFCKFFFVPFVFFVVKLFLVAALLRYVSVTYHTGY